MFHRAALCSASGRRSSNKLLFISRSSRGFTAFTAFTATSTTPLRLSVPTPILLHQKCPRFTFSFSYTTGTDTTRTSFEADGAETNYNSDSDGSTFAPRFDVEGNDAFLDESTVSALLTRARTHWPTPDPSTPLPHGWSATWSSWPYLFTYYWLGPYYLLLPQIEIILNVLHRIRGESRPVMFSEDSNAFVFAMAEDDTQLFYVEGPSEPMQPQAQTEKNREELTPLPVRLWRFDPSRVPDTPSLLRLMSASASVTDADADGAAVPVPRTLLIPVEPDAQGRSILDRILARDESVIPLLADKSFLGYAPIRSMPWEEAGFREQAGGGGDEVQLSDDEEIEMLTRMSEEADRYLEGRGDARLEEEEGHAQGSEGRDLLAEEEEAEEAEPDELEQQLDVALDNIDRLWEVDQERLEKFAQEEDERQQKM